MIIQPDFLEHWKTRLLVQITHDESSPLAVIRFWSHCQNCKAWEFPKMTPTQLGSICRWGARKPACHIALLKSKFIERLPSGGFRAHQWSDYNSKLLHNWSAGRKGGRPVQESKPNKDGHTTITQTEPLANPKLTDKTDQIDKVGCTPLPPYGSPPKVDPNGQERPTVGSMEEAKAGLVGLVGRLASDMRPQTKPSLSIVQHFLSMQFSGAEKYAASYLKAMTKSHWKSKTGEPIRDWRIHVAEYAAAAERKHLGVT